MTVHSAEIIKGMLTLNIEVPIEEQRPYLDRAAGSISRERPMAGFRPGNAPYDVVVRAVGEQSVLEHAAEEMISRTYADAIKDGHYQVIGSPKVQVEMIAPGNRFVYSATVPLLPTVTAGSISELKDDTNVIAVEEHEVEKVVQELREMQSMPSKVDRPSAKSDRVIVDLSMSLDKVPVEGGATKGHAVDLGKPHYLPGFTDQVVGLATGEKKTFTLPFPKEHYQKHLAGKNVDIDVEVKEVQERGLPEVNDAFAQKLGKKDLISLKELLKNNIQTEKDKKEQNRVENDLLKQLVKSSTFTDIPEMLVTQEAHRMLEELEDNVRRQGGEFNDYLASIKKKPEELFIEFAPQALERVKTALLLRTIALEQEFEASEDEVDSDIAQATEQYQKDPEIRERIKSMEMRDYIATLLRNRKVIDWIKGQVKKE